MPLIKKLSARLQNHPKRIVYPEGADPRILQAARQFSTRKLGVPILLGDREKISEIAAAIDVRLDGMKIIDPVKSDDFAELCRIMKALPKFRALDDDGIHNLVSNPNYYSTLMLATGRADAMLAGATTSSSNALRPIFQIIPLQKAFRTASSIMILSTDARRSGLTAIYSSPTAASYRNRPKSSCAISPLQPACLQTSLRFKLRELRCCRIPRKLPRPTTQAS